MAVRVRPAPRWVAGFDIGGTFTDFVAWSPETGQVARHKVLTTAGDPASGAIEGLAELLRRLEATGSRGEHSALSAAVRSAAQDHPSPRLDLAVHGTTLITNALIERKGARTGLVTTRGFRDVLETGTETRYDAYDLNLEKPEPLVPRRLRPGVSERLDRERRV